MISWSTSTLGTYNNYPLSWTTSSTTNTADIWVRRDCEKLIEYFKKTLEREITEDDIMKLLKDDE